jgi:protein tyrosine phosphatase (PTP) superfamily phosphohydrolase (DUF442 family)
MKRLIRICIWTSVVVALLGLGFNLYVEEQGNFHVVSPGELYRSGQLDRDELNRYIRRYHIRTIINLRGRSPGAGWYRAEIELARKAGISHLDYNLSATSEVPAATLDRIIEAMRRAPKPILIHCQAGADRSGLIAAVWRLAAKKDAPARAFRELSSLYGHFPYLGSGTGAMDRSFWKYVAHVKRARAISGTRTVRRDGQDSSPDRAGR